jgi:hypothetical protein
MQVFSGFYPQVIASEYIRGYGREAYTVAYNALQATQIEADSKLMARVCELILIAKEKE